MNASGKPTSYINKIYASLVAVNMTNESGDTSANFWAEQNI